MNLKLFQTIERWSSEGILYRNYYLYFCIIYNHGLNILDTLFERPLHVVVFREMLKFS